MSSVSKQRVVVVAITLTLLLGGQITAASLSAAVTAILFFGWLVGRLERPSPSGDAPPTGTGTT